MTGALTIQRGDIGDLDSIMPIMTAAFDPLHGEAWSAQQCAGALTMPGTMLLIARSGDAAIGFALARTVLEESELLLLAVCPNDRGRGVGKAMLAQLRRELAGRNVSKLFLEVRENNLARTFYAKLGFTKSVSARITIAVCREYTRMPSRSLSIYAIIANSVAVHKRAAYRPGDPRDATIAPVLETSSRRQQNNGRY